jgi:hypothetical protein
MPVKLNPEDVGLGHRPRLSGQLATVPVEHEALLLDQATGTMHQLNPTAAAICSLFDGEATLQELIDDLVAVFEGDPDTISKDVLEVTRELGAKGLLEGVRGDHEADPPAT